MGDASGEGLRLIAAHLAKVKLEFAEREYAAKSRIGNLEHELDDTLLRLEEATKDVANYQAQVKQLQGQNTYKALVQEREKWKSLTDTLRKDNRALRAQIDQLQHGQLQKPWNSSGSGAEPDLLYHPARRRQDSLTDRSAELVQLRSEINFLKHELEDKNVEINALRAKLDRELELKWERSHGGSSGADPVAPNGGGGWKRSLFESVAEVLAPFPHASAEENDADADQESPELYDYNGSTYDNDPRAGHDKRIPTSINHQGGSAHAHHTDAVVESASF
ncbi:Hypothetical Protein FCC1311_087792 [Hondaea fermentalgiana]|uniref:Uncharacterized protein n=1 Tax=Hondaea fermentalgiana TaxID=2315210 RepID=A0A2R5GPL2_9STRA|nr:Hypothetical Protein FCC1311_087792 [Hondaea fermentalgiana]|eukprot:GBG32555.1 Hypothetical Protein FCC1311_087792 [Hondaea fermentalgiana]